VLLIRWSTVRLRHAPYQSIGEERTTLLKACAKSVWPPLRTLVLLAITTGARKGELTGLRWADVDLEKGRALVHETKNDEPRALPLAGQALEALRELKLMDSARSDYVFPQPSGFPGPYEHFDMHWYAALEYLCRNVVEAMRKDGRVLSIHLEEDTAIRAVIGDVPRGILDLQPPELRSLGAAESAADRHIL
jgi:integrase